MHSDPQLLQGCQGDTETASQ